MAKQTKKDFIINVCKENGLELGSWDAKMDALTVKAIHEVADAIGFGGGDVVVTVRRKPLIVELSQVDNEMDFSVLTPEEFEAKYGWNYFDDEE